MVEHTNPKQEDSPYLKAMRLSHSETPLPPEATKPYDGVNGAGQAAIRSAVFATIGWFAGKWIGQGATELSASMPAHALAHARFVERNIAGISAFVGGVWGAYGGMKDATHHAHQVKELQDALRKQHRNVAEFKQALQAVLTTDAEMKTAPKTQVLSTEAQHEAPAISSPDKAV